MNYFYRFYRWAMNIKLFMAMYFVAALFIYSAESLLIGAKSVNIFTMFEMLIVYFITAIVQKLILPDGKNVEGESLKTRAAIWFAISVLITVSAVLFFPWFDGFPSWAPIVFTLFLMAGFVAMWLGILIIHQIDTKKLNEKLNQYQSKNVV